METMTETEPRLWVGCLSCHNGGRLHGAWLTAEQCSEPLRDSAPGLARVGYYTTTADPARALNPGVPTGAAFDRCNVCGGDEWWGMDVEGLPASWSEEMSPADFVGKCELRDQLEGQGYDIDAYVAYEDHVGREYANPDEFMDAYCGHYDSDADYAEELAEDMGAIEPEANRDRWPLYCIDWERAWRELEMGGDNYSVDCPTGGVYVFRAV
jgi:antirestriction protein